MVNNDFGALITHNQSFGALNSLLSLNVEVASLYYISEKRGNYE